jgi:signal transduction histidine kinase
MNLSTPTNTHTKASDLKKGISLFWRLAAGILVIVALTLVIFNMLMQPGPSDLNLMAIFLSITALVSGIASYAAYRLGWFYRSPSLRWSLVGVYILSSALTFLNVFLTARLMFADQHDLQLALVLLIFASGIAVVIGLFFATAFSDRISLLRSSAQEITQGNLEVRVPVEGQDEITELSTAFNIMAANLEEVEHKRKELEALRRDLIAWVSHDLQTPLASVRAILEALADGMVEDPKTVQRYLRTAQKDIASLSILIDDLFQMAKLDAGGMQLDLEESSLSDLISDTLESFSELANQKSISLQGQVDRGVDPVLMDVQRIGRVLNNLVSNALQHTGTGGKVSISSHRREDHIVVQVRDNGSGIAPEDLPKIFDRFYRGEKSRNRTTGGAGLGLAISQGIVEAHHGTISVRSQPDVETCFTFTLPSKG